MHKHTAPSLQVKQTQMTALVFLVALLIYLLQIVFMSLDMEPIAKSEISDTQLPKKPSLLTGTLIGAGIGAGFGAAASARSKPSELLNTAVATAALELPGGGLIAAAGVAALGDPDTAKRVAPQWQKLLDKLDRHQNHTLLMTTVLCSALGAVTGFVLTKLHHRDLAQPQNNALENAWIERLKAEKLSQASQSAQSRQL